MDDQKRVVEMLERQSTKLGGAKGHGAKSISQAVNQNLLQRFKSQSANINSLLSGNAQKQIQDQKFLQEVASGFNEGVDLIKNDIESRVANELASMMKKKASSQQVDLKIMNDDEDLSFADDFVDGEEKDDGVDAKLAKNDSSYDASNDRSFD